MDLVPLFTTWTENVADKEEPRDPFKGVLCEITTKVKGKTTVRVRTEDAVVTVSIPSTELTSVAVMDLVEVNGNTVQQVKPWIQLVIDKAFMCKELVPNKSSSGEGRPFFIYSGRPNAPVWHKTEPGLHRIMEWEPEINNEKEGVVRVTLVQRQWSKLSAFSLDMPPMTMRMILESDQCEALLINDLDKWVAVMRGNPIPFYALVSVDGDATSESISLSTLAVRWDLLAYLEAFCLELSAKTVRSLIPIVAPGVRHAIHNISALGKVPIGTGWRYYALSANRTTQLDQLKEPMILFAAWTEPFSAKPDKKRAKK
jgi:hypothetical protein